jgi:septal ring factor EnvC (AmiA/AmiB activator)
MKKLIVLSIAVLAILFTGCNQAKIAEMEAEILNLQNEKHLADSLTSKFYEFLNEVDNNLAEIKRKEKIISKTTGETRQAPQQKILQDLADISEMMDKNRARLNELESLRRQLRAANVNTQHLQDMIDALKRRVEEQEAEIKELQEKLRVANQRIDVLVVEKQELTEDNERKQAKIEDQIIELNVDYYTIGTSASLREAGIITRSGGFIGIGRTNVVNESMNLNNFTKIDIRDFKRLETNAERIEIITTHAPESFRINNDDRKNLVIEITNPTLFWKSSKFLVVRTR